MLELLVFFSAGCMHCLYLGASYRSIVSFMPKVGSAKIDAFLIATTRVSWEQKSLH